MGMICLRQLQMQFASFIADGPTLKKDVSTSGVSDTVELIEERFVS